MAKKKWRDTLLHDITIVGDKPDEAIPEDPSLNPAGARPLGATVWEEVAGGEDADGEETP